MPLVHGLLQRARGVVASAVRDVAGSTPTCADHGMRPVRDCHASVRGAETSVRYAETTTLAS
ncbi:hypothetical protein GCM10018789_08500 [Streptomyces werraensis]|nr:hypothetical protein GCM10018789_08500 [Streptomyces werraensis]